ncbi:MAG: hypothetical protein M1483_02520 [Actinobacteria bacterium]|nr:hypothetical protein [Actinomycetota bacterium]MCL6104499.1 hypothetical protein [Actinomycetota bacterium]
MLNTATSTAAFLLCIAFSMSTMDKWLEKATRHYLVWSIALIMAAVAAATMAISSTAGWSGITFRIFYLFGGILNVPWLALGTVYLLTTKRIGDISAIIVTAYSAFSIGVLFSTPLLHPVPLHQLAQGSKVFSILPQVLAGTGSSAGALVIIAGALFSIVKVQRARVIISNCLIAAGVMIMGASGVLNSIFDQMVAFSVTLALGIAVIFAGFLTSSAAQPSPAGKQTQI